MNDQTARSLFMDYLYDEITPEEKEKLESYLKDHPSLREELNKLEKTRSLLQQMPVENPSQKLLVMEPGKRTFRQWWNDAKQVLPQSNWGKAGFAIAAGLILLLFVGSIANLHVAQTGQGFTITLGESPAQEGLTAEQAEALVNQIREENALMLTEFAREMNQQNNRQLQQVVNYFEQQRRNDLQLIDENLDQFQQTSNYRWQQANEYLGAVLQNVSFNNQQ